MKYRETLYAGLKSVSSSGLGSKLYPVPSATLN